MSLIVGHWAQVNARLQLWIFALSQSFRLPLLCDNCARISALVVWKFILVQLLSPNGKSAYQLPLGTLLLKVTGYVEFPARTSYTMMTLIIMCKVRCHRNYLPRKQARNQLETPGGVKSFLRKFHVQHIFPGGGESPSAPSGYGLARKLSVHQ